MNRNLQSGAKPRNVIFIGEIGAGKSSIINLIADVDVARTSNDAAACTTEIAHYDVQIWGRTYRLWDTPGLNAPSRFRFSVPESEQGLKSFLRERYLAGEIDLLVFCVRSGRTLQVHGKCLQNFLQNDSSLCGPSGYRGDLFGENAASYGHVVGTEWEEARTTGPGV
ncbi:hypothetical protein PAXINDRAFT_173108 [Paxillus involutus ATCC 200175]|uniref:G domain-containing protein n=1 Tax=Paxillus involutus ATCC 200175 TaxID=664439 RepID=A0A0C9SNJ9_PAXIN|nr:hypothetical protein PAXINDRAFT_173108 [Paxillus involutus ATCC 200175]